MWDETAKEWTVSSGPVLPGADGVSVLNYLTGDRTITEAINAAFADESIEATQVYFPPGEYEIDDTLESELDGKTIHFVAGSVLIFQDATGAALRVLGLASRVTGFPVIRFDEADEANPDIAVDLAGEDSSLDWIRFEMNGARPNCTLLRLSGDYTRAGTVIAEGTREFNIMVQMANDGGTQVLSPVVGPIRWIPVDNGVVRNYGSLLEVSARGWELNGLYCNAGGRDFIDSIIHLTGVSRQGRIYNPEAYATQALWGIRGEDNSEFLEIFGGIFHQSSDGVTARVGSQGFELGEGSWKVYGTKIIGFDIGVRFTGSCDATGFFGGVIANNKTANVQVDTGIWPVSALSFHGGYMESVAVDTCIPIHVKTGEVDGMMISGMQLSSSNAAVPVIQVDDTAVGVRGCVLSGCRFPQVPGASVTRPNVGSSFLFLYNQFFGSFSIATGPYASYPNVTSIDALTNASQATSSLTISTATLPGDAILGQWFDFFTANYGAGIPANSFVELDLPFAEVTALNKFVLSWTLTGTLAANGGLLFTCYLHDAGFIRLRATNITGSNIGAISGTLFVTVQKVRP